MTEHEGPYDTELQKGLVEQFGLLQGTPASVTRALAVAVARSIEGDYAVALARLCNKTADFHIGDHRAVAMQQHKDGISATGINEMQSDSIDGNELASRRVFPFGAARFFPNKE